MDAKCNERAHALSDAQVVRAFFYLLGRISTKDADEKPEVALNEAIAYAELSPTRNGGAP